MKGWHFLPADGCMAYDDNRKVAAGETYTVDCKPVLCESGLHWSTRFIDALAYQCGPILCRVESVEGHPVIQGDDKCVSTARRVIAMSDATDLLFELSRIYAAQVFWKHFKREDYPDVVRWLDNGDSTARSAARSAAWSAAWSAAESAARSAAWSAAWTAAESAVWSAAWSAAESAVWSEMNAIAEQKALALLGCD